MATAMGNAAEADSEWVEKVPGEGGSAERVKKKLFLKSKKRVFKWEVGVSIKRVRERERVRAALKRTDLSWEIFMEFYLKNGDMKSLLRCVDRGIKKGRSFDMIWVLPEDVIFALMPYFEDPHAEGFIELLKAVKLDLGTEVFESLIRAYAAAGKKRPGM